MTATFRFEQGNTPVVISIPHDGRELAPGMEGRMSDAVLQAARGYGYSMDLNGRFKGGHITRHYGNPGDDIHAVQLELAQRAYMDEGTLHYDEVAAGRLREAPRAMLSAFLSCAGRPGPSRRRRPLGKDGAVPT